MGVLEMFSGYLGRAATAEKHSPKRINDYVQSVRSSAQYCA
jgi:hypothetical protein